MAEPLPQIVMKCLSCPFRCGNENDFLKHLSVHKFESNFRIPCRFCPQTFKEMKYYMAHKNLCAGQKHCEQTIDPPDVNNHTLWECKNCLEKLVVHSVQNITDYQKVTSHVFQHSRNNEKVKCPFCNVSYDKYKALNRHVNIHKAREEFSIQSIDRKFAENLAEHTDEIIPIIPEENSYLNVDQNAMPEVDIITEDIPEIHEEENVFTFEEIYAMNSEIEQNEAKFALKLSAKHLISREVISEIMSFCSEIHCLKMEFIKAQLHQKFANHNDLKIKNVTDTMDVIDYTVGLKKQLLSPYQREQYLKLKFQFIEPRKNIIGSIGSEISFCYTLPIVETLGRMLKDDYLRKFVIKEPTFTTDRVQLTI